MSKRTAFKGFGDEQRPEHLPRYPDTPHRTAKISGIVVAGQRWISEMEPELGPGRIVQVDMRRVTIAFHEGTTTRVYARENAPLRRVRFKEGDQIRLADGKSHIVRSVEEKEGLLIYQIDKGDISETELSAALTLTAPLDRLLAGFHNSSSDFNLRRRILDLRQFIAHSTMRGFAGGRIDLLPHQIYIAHEVSSRHVRRVMLADEVGLGKTIEACLILHRLIASGRTVQALIIVPDALVNVWFVELLRKFNLLFKIFDKDYFDSVRPEGSSENPFLGESLILTTMGLFTEREKGRSLAGSISWDILIVDEAHHLQEGTRAFELIEALSKKAKDLLLLTATPQQYGERNHFARLRMIDPSRYVDFEAFLREAREHRHIAAVTGRLLDGEKLPEGDVQRLRGLFNDGETLIDARLAKLEKNPLNARQELVAELLDRHGIGRAMFRNTRSAIGGFPVREVFMAELECSKSCRVMINALFMQDLANTELSEKRKLRDDPRVEYVAGILRRIDQEKLLVICRSKETASALDEALKKIIAVHTALFHEDLTLLQRDRNAAWFAEDEGARILICSEIGSEGRNFQFVHHLILFDLPPEPELVEQRIGRLDRIGQSGPIKIYVPYVKGTHEYLLARWYQEGFGIFEATVPAAQEVFDALGEEIFAIIHNKDLPETEERRQINDLIARTRILTTEVTKRLKEGRDRLLEQHSFRPREAAGLVTAIRDIDKTRSLKEVMEKLFSARGIQIEEFNDHTWKLWSEAQLDDTFPGLRSARPVVTFNRAAAVHREDIEFLSIDHPAVQGGIDLYLASETGNASLALWKKGKCQELLLETLYVVECIAPKELFADRFLPPAVIRVVIDFDLKERAELSSRIIDGELEEIMTLPILDNNEIKQRLIPMMQQAAQRITQERCGTLIENALAEMKRTIFGEVERLRTLRRINPAITEQEISLAQNEALQLAKVIRAAAPRLDALRLIWSPGK